MSIQSIGFIGGGRIARIMLEGWSRKGGLPARIAVSEPDPKRREELASRFHGIRVTSESAEAASCDLVILGIHPPQLVLVLGQIKEHLMPSAIVLSLAPKHRIETIETALNGFKHIARMNPNAASLVGEGFNPIVFGQGLSDEDRSAVRTVLEPLGKLPEVTEEKIETYAVLTAMGPTYFWFQFQLLRELARSFGLEALEADSALQHMISGSSKTFFSSGLEVQDVMDLVPAKPLLEMEPIVTEWYRSRIPAMHAKIRP